MVVPSVILTHLNRADGSATYTHNGFSIIGAVNGPIEVPRRDELPEEAVIEVNVRPAVGVGSPRERHLEFLVHATLRSIILTRLIPRTLVQVTLQVKSLPEEDASTGVDSSLTLLPHLLHAALLALLSASIPLSTTLISILVAVPSAPSNKTSLLVAPTANELLRAKPIRSIHIFAFSGARRLLLNESDGKFSYDDWSAACKQAEEICCGSEDDEEEEDGGVKLCGEEIEIDGAVTSESLKQWLKEVVRAKVEGEQSWKTAT